MIKLILVPTLRIMDSRMLIIELLLLNLNLKHRRLEKVVDCCQVTFSIEGRESYSANEEKIR